MQARTFPLTALVLGVLSSTVAIAQPGKPRPKAADKAPQPIVIAFDQFAGIPAFSPQGHKLAVWNGNSLDLYDPATGRPTVAFPPSQLFVKGLCWTPDGEQVIAYGDAIQFFNIARGRVGRKITPPSDVFQLAVSPDGQSFAWTSDAGAVLVQSLTGDQSATLLKSSSGITALVWRGDYLYASGSIGDPMVRVWTPANGKLVREWRAHRTDLDALTLTGDGDVVTLGGTGDVDVWTVDLEKPSQEPKSRALKGAQYASVLACLTDGQTIVSANEHDLVCWDEQGELIRTLRGHDGSVTGLSVSGDGQYLASRGGSQVLIWKAPEIATGVKTGTTTGELTADGVITLDAHSGAVQALSVSPDGKTLAALVRTDPMQLLVWQLPSHDLVGEHDAGSPPAFGLDFAAAAPLLGFQNGAGRLFQVDLRREKVSGNHYIDDTGIGRLALSRNGRQLLLAGAVSAFWIDLSSGKVISRSAPAQDRVVDVALANDEKTYVAAVGSQVLHVDTRSGRTLGELSFPSRVQGVDLSPDGALLAVAADRSLTLWDLKTRQRVRTFEEPLEFNRQLVISPDGALLAVVGYPQEVRLWNVATGKLVTSLTGHTADVQAVAFSPDGKWLYTGGDDKTVKEWELVKVLPPSTKPAPTAKLSGPSPKSNARTTRLSDLDQWEVVRGKWIQGDQRITGEGNSLIRSRDVFPNDLTFRCKLKVNGATNPRIRFDAFHFGYEGRQQQFFLHGPKATGVPFPFQVGQEYAIEVRIAGDTAALLIDGQQVAESHPKRNDSRIITIEAGGARSKSSADFAEIEVIAPAENSKP